MQSWLKNLHIERYGPVDAEPVVMLHGWGSNAGLMRPLALALQDKYRVFNIDLPGHGLTPPPPEPWGVPEHAALVQAFIDEEIKQPAHMVGHSNGGRISFFMASDPAYASSVHSLSLISPSGVKPKRTLKYHFRKGLATTLKAPFSILPAGLQTYGLDWLRHTLVWQWLGSSDYSQLQGVMRGVFVKTVNCLLDDRLALIKAPAIFFWGTDDTSISKYQMDVATAKIQGSEMIILEGASHYGHLDQPAIVTEGMRHFLSHHPMRHPTPAE
ncbi:MAG: alpha/beta fold hydrolase [Rhodothermales bacterium]